MRPNGKLDLAVKTAPGAVVTVAAVDEGILQLIDRRRRSRSTSSIGSSPWG